MPDEIDLTSEENLSLDKANDQVGRDTKADFLAGQTAARKGLRRDARQGYSWLQGYDQVKNQTK